jgi:FlaG/FlaF family flagellin (archaellin)
MVVVVLMGVISVSVIPAFESVQTMREGAARDDILRMFEIAKGRSVASGIPHGLDIDLIDSTVSIVEIDSGGSIQLEYDPLTNSDKSLNITQLYPGVEIETLTNGNGDSGSGTVWFDFESTPHVRNQDGSFDQLNAQTVTMTLSSGKQIVVHPYSGAVEAN